MAATRRSTRKRTERSSEDSDAASSSSSSSSSASSSTAGEWKDEELVIVRRGSAWLSGLSEGASVGIAAFDMDGTLIETESGKTFYTRMDDWKWTFASVPTRMGKIVKEENLLLVVISNQNGISKGKVSRKEVTGRFDGVFSRASLDNFMAIMVPSSDGDYRKPGTGAWGFVVRELESRGIKVDMEKSFYVGDAAGRAAAWNGDKKRKKDFSCGDRKFAANCGLTFKTPEEYFLKMDAAKFSWGSVDPAGVVRATEGLSECAVPILPEPARQELVLFVGFPGCGKSSFFARHFAPAGYLHVSRDVLGTMPKCQKALREAMQSGSSAVVDNTSPTQANRADFIRIAQEFKVPVRCFFFMADRELANHLNQLRAMFTDRERVPSIAYNRYKSSLQEPSTDEGIEQVVQVNFIPDLSSEEARKRFLMWTED